MTIAELKESIEKMRIKEPDELGKAYNNALDFCLEMIDVYDKFREDEQALSQEPCDDAISRKKAICVISACDGKSAQIEALEQLPSVTQTPKYWIDKDNKLYKMPDDIPTMINALPSVTQKSGKWIEKDGWDGDVYYECSICGEPFCLIDGTPTDNMYNYCPNCGAKMVEPQESEDKG